MRLLSLEVAGFRGFATKQTLDLNADAVIVVGANGNGKTSLFDAILWAISGRIPRLGKDDPSFACRFSDTGQARVVLRLGGSDGSSATTVTRVFDGAGTKVSVETRGGVARGPEAEGQLIQQVWPEAATASDPAEALATALTRSVYLQQDLVREFIDSVSAQDRFSVVSELVGAGRVTELQSELERAKKAWSQVTNSRAAELLPLRDRLATMEFRIAELRERSSASDRILDINIWAEWWNQIQSFQLKIADVPMTSRDAPGAIDAAIKQLDAARSAAERRKANLNSLAQELTRISNSSKPDLAVLRNKLTTVQKQIQDLRGRIATEQSRVADLRRAQAELKEKSEQLQALAILALKHLESKCPVCDQQYDVDSTRTRLQALASRDSTQIPVSLPADTLTELLALLSLKEKELSATDLEVRAAAQSARDIEIAEAAAEKRLKDLGIELKPSSEPLNAVSLATTSTTRRIDDLTTAQQTGEALALRLSQSVDQAAVQELTREIEVARTKLSLEDAELARRSATGEQAQAVIEALREAASRVVTERVKEIEPLLSDIYSRIDVHPAFRAVRYLTSIIRGRGQLSTIVSDPLSQVESDLPATVLSSSQMNVLAVSTFLSLNLGVTKPPLESAILDDPLQSLDDINLLGLIDLLRRTKDRRQLLVSTHDTRFGSLLARKLRPGSPEQRTIVIELDGWTRTGPTITTRDVRSDPTSLRLISVG